MTPGKLYRAKAFYYIAGESPLDTIEENTIILLLNHDKIGIDNVLTYIANGFIVIGVKFRDKELSLLKEIK